jgi:hypothetical protein
LLRSSEWMRSAKELAPTNSAGYVCAAAKLRSSAGITTVFPSHAAIDTSLYRAFDNIQIELDAAINQPNSYGAPDREIARYKLSQWIVDVTGLVKRKNIAIVVHGILLSLRVSGRLHSRLDTPPMSLRHHAFSRIAPSGFTRSGSAPATLTLLLCGWRLE